MVTCMTLTLAELHELEEGIVLSDGDEAFQCDVDVLAFSTELSLSCSMLVLSSLGFLK